MTRTVDFDAFRAEQKLEPLKLRIGGKERELPPSLPAALALDVIRLQEALGPDADPGVEDLMKIGAGLFGGKDAFLEVLADGGVGMTELPSLIEMIIAEYTRVPDPNPATQE